MAVKRRRPKHCEPSEPADARWLRGEDSGGFTECFSQERLRALWDEYGDKEHFHWTEGQWAPVARTTNS
jgi:hypothetical protein